ncbi:MAG: YybH family protein [Candidatus Acidiferrales bacterium]
MSLTRTIATLAFSAALAISVLPARSQDQSSAEDPSAVAVKQIVSNYAERVNRHDAHDVVSLFALAADFTDPSGVTIHGRNAIQDYFTSQFAGTLKAASRTSTVYDVRLLSPEIAAVDGVWELVATREANGSMNPLRQGRFDYVLTKQGGRWFITIFHECNLPNLPAESSAK